MARKYYTSIIIQKRASPAGPEEVLDTYSPESGGTNLHDPMVYYSQRLARKVPNSPPSAMTGPESERVLSPPLIS